MTDTLLPGGPAPTAPPTLHHVRPPIWRNTTFLKWSVQIVVFVAVVAAFWFLADQAVNNLDQKGIPAPNYDWINDPSNIQASEGIQTAATEGKPFPFSRALWVGMTNTLRVAGAGIVFSTILGVLIGIARLSKNWLASKVAGVYIETLRNIPVLVQIILWFAIIGSLPEIDSEQAGETGWFFINKKGISLPAIRYGATFYQFAVLLAVFGVVIWFVRRRYPEAERGRVTLIGSLAALVVAWFANPIMSWFGVVFDGLGGAWDILNADIIKVLLALAGVGGAALFIKRFLDSRRTPAGLAKLTDDDWFRMIFAGLGALLFITFVYVVWPGIGSWTANTGASFFDWGASRFGDGRSGQPLDGFRPSLTDGGRFVNIAPTGLTMTAFFASLFFGLVFYTSSFIAEIVRGGIQAVPKGQTEAAAALGLSRSQALRKVVLPQAFRIVMPPLGNQYLNITKNTSLAIAVGLSDIVQLGQTVYNKNNQTLAVFGIFMLFFLTCSLTISLVVNFINRKLAIVER